jgi:hypothetical protein
MGMVALAVKTDNTRVSEILETSALAKVQAACNFVNAEVNRLRNKTIAIVVICIAAVFVLWMITGLGDVSVALVIAAGISIFVVVRARSELASSFTSLAAKRIVAGLGQGLTYKPTSSLTKRHFVAMDLFPERCERWQSSDEIGGKAGGAKYTLHRVRAGGGDRKVQIFQGVIMKLDFSDNFPAHTIIVPDQSGQLTLAAKATPSSGKKKDLVMMKNPVFERMFSVHSSDYYEARKLVTPEFMRIVMDAQEALGAEMRLCFMQRSLYVTVAGDAIRFQPTLFAEPLTPQAAVGTLVPLVALAQRLAQTRDSSQ